MFPIMLDVAGRAVVVVGAGPVGLRKAHSLRQAGAKVTLVAASIDPNADTEGMTVLAEPYKPQHVGGAMLVMAATDDRALNARIAADARAAGALVNAADQPEDCDFHLPAVVTDGPITVAIATGGASPGLSAFLKGVFAGALPPRIGQFAELLGRLRLELRQSPLDIGDRIAIMKDLSSQRGYELFIAHGEPALRQELARLMHRD